MSCDKTLFIHHTDENVKQVQTSEGQTTSLSKGF